MSSKANKKAGGPSKNVEEKSAAGKSEPEKTATGTTAAENATAIKCKTKDKLRVGALALSQDYTNRARRVTLDELAGYLRTGLSGSQADVVLCSAFVLTGVAPSDDAKVAAHAFAAAGRPVLFEREGPNEENAWFMATQQTLHPLRKDQYIKEVDEIRPRSEEVLREIAKGMGQIQVLNHMKISRLVLFICNEGKLLSAFRLKGLWKSETDEAKTKLNDALKLVMDGRWLLLHPAHRPYAGFLPRSGGDLVSTKTYRQRDNGKVIGAIEHPPRLRSVIGQPLAFGRGLIGPKYTLHAGSFRPSKADREIATLMFTAKGSRRGSLQTTQAKDVEIRYAEFEV